MLKCFKRPPIVMVDQAMPGSCPCKKHHRNRWMRLPSFYTNQTPFRLMFKSPHQKNKNLPSCEVSRITSPRKIQPDLVVFSHSMFFWSAWDKIHQIDVGNDRGNSGFNTNGLNKTDSRKITLVSTLSQNTYASDLCTCKTLGGKLNSFNSPLILYRVHCIAIYKAGYAVEGS